MRTRTLCAGLVVVGLMATGCASSPWRETLKRGPDVSPTALDRGAGVRVQSVPWERVEKTLAEIRQDVINSDTHPDDWSSEKKVATKGKLLKGLQVQGDPASVLVVGKSEFQTTSSFNTDKDLEAVARQLGADMVVYSTRVVGKGTKIINEPVTSYTSGTFWERDTDGRHRPQTYTEHHTSWVPIAVSADEVMAIAFYLRTGRPVAAR